MTAQIGPGEDVADRPVGRHRSDPRRSTAGDTCSIRANRGCLPSRRPSLHRRAMSSGAWPTAAPRTSASTRSASSSPARSTAWPPTCRPRSDSPALLKLIARTAGAKRVAVLADGIDRRSAVSVAPGEDPGGRRGPCCVARRAAPSARGQSGRPRRRRRCRSSRVGPAVDRGRRACRGRPPPAAVSYALLRVPGPGGVVLGFEFGGAVRAARPGRSASRRSSLATPARPSPSSPSQLAAERNAASLQRA